MEKRSSFWCIVIQYSQILSETQIQYFKYLTSSCINPDTKLPSLKLAHVHTCSFSLETNGSRTTDSVCVHKTKPHTLTPHTLAHPWGPFLKYKEWQLYSWTLAVCSSCIWKVASVLTWHSEAIAASSDLLNPSKQCLFTLLSPLSIPAEISLDTRDSSRTMLTSYFSLFDCCCVQIFKKKYLWFRKI